VLIASTYPLEVVQADRWARNNKQLTGDDAVKAVENQDGDPSVKALVAFPDVLTRMSNDLDWTQQLGDAFLADESRVMDTVQSLRNKAYASGNLDKVEHVKVVREERIITIEPAVERVVYVPVYDTRVVYGSWWWPDYPPVYWHHPHGYSYVSGFYWGPRVYIGSSFFFSGCHWRDRRVVVIDHHHHHSHGYYNNRSIVHYRDSRHWHHNPTHRRGVAYYDNRTRERFNSPRESYRESRVYRTNYANPNIRPNQAREQRQGATLNRPESNRPESHNKDRFMRDRDQTTNTRETRVVGGGRMAVLRMDNRLKPLIVRNNYGIDWVMHNGQAHPHHALKGAKIFGMSALTIRSVEKTRPIEPNNKPLTAATIIIRQELYPEQKAIGRKPTGLKRQER
jgi:hypothetical protein